MIRAKPISLVQPEQREARARLEWIDVLRGFASVAVALFHSMSVFWIGMYHNGSAAFSRFDRVVAYLSIPVHYGYAGVMLFFLLSGFVIHLPYAKAAATFSLGPYFGRRIARIYPPYLVALLVTLGALALVPALVAEHDGARRFVKAIFMLQNYPHDGGNGAELAGAQPFKNLALWSLPVEIELYLAYPIVLWAVRTYGISKTSVTIVSASLLATLSDLFLDPSGSEPANFASYLPTFLHFWAIWCAGAWLADRMVAGGLPLWNLRWTAALSIATALALIARQKLHLAREVEDYVWGCVFFCFLIWLLAKNDRNAALGNAWGGLRYLGKMSYSLYLVHLPVFFILAGTLLAAPLHRSANFLVCVVGTIVAIVAGAGFYELIEKPIGKFAHGIGRNSSARRQKARAPER